jgi:hypothetical protein
MIDMIPQNRCLENKEKDVLRMAVLIPHRDARKLARAWSSELFAAGLSGAWSFPWTVPLAVLQKPLSRGELKTLALKLRTLSLEQEQSGMIRAEAVTSELPFLPGFSLYGPVLNLKIDFTFFEKSVTDKIIRLFPSLILASALVEDNTGLMKTAAVSAPPALSFRAAAVANMSYKVTDTAAFTWKIGQPAWLPAPGAHTGRVPHE